MKIFNYDRQCDCCVITADRLYTYGEILDFSERIKSLNLSRNLVLSLCENSIGSVSRASSIFFSRAVEDTSGASSRWSRVPAGRRGPGRGCGLRAARRAFGPGAAWPGGRGSGTWGLLRRRNPRLPLLFRAELGTRGRDFQESRFKSWPNSGFACPAET